MKGKKYLPADDHGSGYFPPPTRLFQRVHIDHVGPLPKSKFGSKFLLVIVDVWSKFALAIPTKTISSEENLRLFKERWCSIFRALEILISDQGKCFILTQKKGGVGSGSQVSAVYPPLTNGAVENVNGTLKNSL